MAHQARPLPTEGPISPYLVLGLRYGADLAEARAAFISATKRLTQFDPPPFRLDDLTWALHQIEHGGTDGSELRIPADPELIGTGNGDGLFQRPPAPMRRATEPLGEQTRVRLLQRALQEIAHDVLGNAESTIQAPPVYEVT